MTLPEASRSVGVPPKRVRASAPGHPRLAAAIARHEDTPDGGGDLIEAVEAACAYLLALKGSASPEQAPAGPSEWRHCPSFVALERHFKLASMSPPDRFTALLKQGCSIPDALEAAGPDVSRFKVDKWRREHPDLNAAFIAARWQDQTPLSQLTAEEVASLRAAWSDPSVPISEIAERFSVHPQTISRWRRKLDLPSRRTGGDAAARTDESFVAQLVEIFEQEPVAFAEAARRCGLPLGRLKRLRADPEFRARLDEARRECLERMRREVRERVAARKRGLLTQPRRPYAARPQISDPEVERQLRELWASPSFTATQIAAELGVSLGTVENWKRALGLPHRSNHHPGREPSD
ncbi:MULTISPECIES: hypothetical protein [unclassified Streptomyces]|uniref:hypothetical protein n=1 Tax=unclassified Streptomyces TaxID=2593676 RepID=UPI00115FB841|nr:MULTISPECIES: hypothetical protein [unclassified Streptomyces]